MNYDRAYFDAFTYCDINALYHVKVCGNNCYSWHYLVQSLFIFVAEAYFAPNTFQLFKGSK